MPLYFDGSRIYLSDKCANGIHASLKQIDDYTVILSTYKDYYLSFNPFLFTSGFAFLLALMVYEVNDTDFRYGRDIQPFGHALASRIVYRDAERKQKRDKKKSYYYSFVSFSVDSAVCFLSCYCKNKQKLNYFHSQLHSDTTAHTNNRVNSSDLNK